MIFRYKCKKCGTILEMNKKMSDPHPTSCKCGGLLGRQYSPTNVIYRSGGFSVTDKRLDPKPDDD